MNPSIAVRQYLLIVAIIILSDTTVAQQLPRGDDFSGGKNSDYGVEVVVSGLGVPWGMVFLDSDTILFTELDGAIALLDTEMGTIRPIKGGPEVWARGQGGLLDVALPAGYKPGDWIYFTYSKEQGGTGVTTLARARLENDRLIGLHDLVVTVSASNTTHHFGSRIAFDRAGHIFFSVGDRGYRPNGQDLHTHAGSVLRVNLDGSVPDDNPFVHQDGALPEIWSYGHRNPQGIVYDSKNGRLWINEHGPRGGDEINLVLPGRNYGWPVVSHGKEYWGPSDVGEAKSKPGMENPRKIYIPSIAPSSLLLYDGDAFPQWRGSLFSGALKLTHLNRVAVDDHGNIVGEERLLEKLNERIRQVIQSPDGRLYLSTDSGKIMRLKPP
jgi:aldose sugar dehydrogenase